MASAGVRARKRDAQRDAAPVVVDTADAADALFEAAANLERAAEAEPAAVDGGRVMGLIAQAAKAAAPATLASGLAVRRTRPVGAARLTPSTQEAGCPSLQESVKRVALWPAVAAASLAVGRAADDEV
jgi:hypothetical protein